MLLPSILVRNGDTEKFYYYSIQFLNSLQAFIHKLLRNSLMKYKVKGLLILHLKIL
jgi:hypothetical protein